MKSTILTQIYCTLSITLDHIYPTWSRSFKNLLIHNISLQASVVLINLASVVDKARYFCNLDCHDTPPKLTSLYLSHWPYLHPCSLLTLVCHSYSINMPWSNPSSASKSTSQPANALY